MAASGTFRVRADTQVHRLLLDVRMRGLLQQCRIFASPDPWESPLNDYDVVLLPQILPEMPELKGIQFISLHGKMKQSAREQTLSKFAASDSGVLLCTDLAARGLDIPDVNWIIQMDPPQVMPGHLIFCCTKCDPATKCAFLEPDAGPECVRSPCWTYCKNGPFGKRPCSSPLARELLRRVSSSSQSPYDRAYRLQRILLWRGSSRFQRGAQETNTFIERARQRCPRQGPKVNGRIPTWIGSAFVLDLPTSKHSLQGVCVLHQGLQRTSLQVYLSAKRP